MSDYANKYTDYVLCKRNWNQSVELFIAPAFSNLEQGDLVVVEPEGKDMLAKVMAVITIENTDIKSKDFVLQATRTEGKIKRILSKIRYHVYEYEEDDND